MEVKGLVEGVQGFKELLAKLQQKKCNNNIKNVCAPHFS